MTKRHPMHPLAVGYKYPIRQSMEKRRPSNTPLNLTPDPQIPCNTYVFRRSSFIRLSMISGNPPPTPNVLLPGPFR